MPAAKQPTPEAVVWTDPAHAQLCAAVLARIGSRVQVLAVGGPPTGELVDLARQIGCSLVDDLRRLINDQPAAHFFLATTQAVSAADLHACLMQGTCVLAVEPVVADLTEWSTFQKLAGGRGMASVRGGIFLLPAFVQTPGWRASADAVQNLGRLEAAVFLLRSRISELSICALLVDAWTTLLQWYDLPDTVTAAFYSTSGLYFSTSSARQLCGRLHVLARLADGRVIQLYVSDRAVSNGRWLYLSGEQGQLEVSDAGYKLLDTAGHLVNGQVRGNSVSDSANWADLIADQWWRLLDHGGGASMQAGLDQGVDRALACVQACLLSCQTGQPESPATLLRLHALQ